MPSRYSRRQLLAALPLALRSAATGCADLATPYKLGRLVLAASGVESEFDSRSVDCPFVFHHEGRYWMTFVGFDGVGYQTGLASSDDLIHWRKEGCILRRDPSSPVTRYNIALTWILRENALRSPGRLRKVRGRYLGVYHAYPRAGYEEGPAAIGLCWSADLRRWTIEPPCLRPEEGAGWERGGLYKACIVEDGGRYYLLYNAKDEAPRHWREQIGVAWSDDLKTWTRYEGNPILRNGPPGSPDERFAADPCVLRDGSRWVIFYYGLDAKGVARDLAAESPDLRRTAKCETVLIDVGPEGSVDATYAHKPSVVWHGGDLYHFYCAVSGRWPREVRGISVARSRPW